MRNSSICSIKKHSVPDRIVSIEQPWVRPIVRGKAKTPIEFGVKFDLSLDTECFGRIKMISFDAYNESNVLISAIERFRERTGSYPERVLADQIYRSRSSLNYCKAHRIRVSGPKLGRKAKTVKRSDRIREYRDNTGRML